MPIVLLSALCFFLLQFRYYTRGSREVAFKNLDATSPLRPILKRYWVLSNLAALASFTSMWAALTAAGSGETVAAILSWLIFAASGASLAVLGALPDYIVMKAANRRREKSREAAARRKERRLAAQGEEAGG